ncbi:PAQR family membrane homeostasis protein TrhA [Pontivivens ytuae]|uniref:Hemolysin III family protein n=1 Tax=Pontivivens ytuae TaxID=2789856 RepID=A0A7S9QDH9_9RHOB|nr:hemolysin III family protein [Pontivivens ytuae]QPH54412.1 hemolysin III family protein [Pontivivens ytuae]
MNDQSTYVPVYPAYARSERIADGIIHVLGIAGAAIGVLFLMIWAATHLGVGQVTALAVYGSAMMAMFVASACYHMTPWEAWRPFFRRIDQAAIYLKIAGTYTPLVVIIGSFTSYFVLAVVWALAAIGVFGKLFLRHRPGPALPWTYLAMGWMSVLLLWSLVSILPWAASTLIVTGGLLYTIGVVFYSWESLKFSNAIWHGFVVAATVCFYAAIVLGMRVSVVA